ncbi:Alkylglycerol monooxygenase [Armadillidium nasatum]|uniref:Alkylglycerol monooxygenase n=1 Tax=Armadillidium nasatum TaxID=96803 RepID=A0A5N5SYJ6_9CRUS|nr:Alkylglycerol monooxygenase [Armadillidium nasatum]
MNTEVKYDVRALKGQRILFTKTLEVFFYEWLYEKRFWTLDWESPWTWWAAAISVDFCYYWVHRAVHEVSLFWASHQVHHSSEEYNLTTALRQSAVQHLFSIGFYLPLALLGVPTAAFDVSQVSITSFYSYYSSKLLKGINKWCLDKNYAGFLIIWDRIFGTFEPERKDEKIIYGLVSQPQTMNPLYLQVFYFRDVIVKSLSMKTFGDKLKALFFGPGWNPGTPRLGDEDAIPDETPERENSHTSATNDVYSFCEKIWPSEIVNKDIIKF